MPRLGARPGERLLARVRDDHNRRVMTSARSTVGLIARCADVQRALGFAVGHGLRVAVRGGGHSVAGFSTCDDGVLIDLGLMRTGTVDADARVARAEPGVTGGRLRPSDPRAWSGDHARGREHVGVLVDRASDIQAPPALELIVEHMGGAIAAGDGAFAHRDATCDVLIAFSAR